MSRSNRETFSFSPPFRIFEEMKLDTVKKYVKRILDALGADKRAAAAAEYERRMSGREE